MRSTPLGYSFSVADNPLLVCTVCLFGSGGVAAIGPRADKILLGVGFGFFSFSPTGFPDIALATKGSAAAVP